MDNNSITTCTVECFKISMVILGMLSYHEVTAWLVSVVNETLGSTLSEFELFFMETMQFQVESYTV